MPLSVSLVSDEKELTDIDRLRYKVYCREWGYETPESHSSGMVTDVYDSNALHFAAKNESQKIVGSVILIVDSPEGFPIEKYCQMNIDTTKLPREGLAEISRLVIHRDYRKRSDDNFIYGPDEERRSIGSFEFPGSYQNQNISYRRTDDKYMHKTGNRRTRSETISDKRNRHEVLLNLYKAVYQESKRRNLTHWYAFMTKGILTLLNKLGFEFKAIGDPVDYHGIRTPYLGEIEKIDQGLSVNNPGLSAEFNNNI
jgi:N-acyl-L-homoserine lactone synthetase